MGYTDPNATKYMVKAKFNADGIVDKPDVVGAVFGQTEGLLGEDLDLRDLQKSGRIGRIEVDVASKGGKSEGVIYMSSSLDQVETVIIAATLETVDRVGPCKAGVKVLEIEDVRIAKREKIVVRAKELLSELMERSKGSGANIASNVRTSVQIEEITTYGRERLPAGPNVKSSESVIIVEGRSDVLNLLRAGIKNAVAVEGTNIPKTVQELSKDRITTAFVDGDRGGELILRELFQTSEIDYVARAPRAHEVEELSTKQLVKCLRNKVAGDQYMEMNGLSYEESELSDEEPEGNRSGRRREDRDESRGRNNNRKHSRRVAGNPEDVEEKPAPRNKPKRREDRFADSEKWKKKPREEPAVEEQTVDVVPSKPASEDKVDTDDKAASETEIESVEQVEEFEEKPAVEEQVEEFIPAKPSRRTIRAKESEKEEPKKEETKPSPAKDKTKEKAEEPEKEEPEREEPKAEEPKKRSRKSSKAEKELTSEQEAYRDMLRDVLNTHNSILMDADGKEIDKVAVRSLSNRLKNAEQNSVATIVYDGVLSQNIANISSQKGVVTLVCKRKGTITKMPEGITVWTREDLE